MLVQAMAREGFSESCQAVLRHVLSGLTPKSFEDAVRAFEKEADRTPELALEIGRAARHLRETVHVNATCYLRSTPEQTRVVQWPNNQSAKVNAPEHYFDIYEDDFYRQTHRFVDKSTPIGSAGSCFALRIAHQLQAWGYNYVIEEDDLPPDFPLDNLSQSSYRMAPARVGTLFNVPSMRQMVERAFGCWEPEKIIARDGSRILDPFRDVRPLYSDEEGYERDYQAHTEALKRALLKCEVFVLTLGLIEAWQFAHSGDYTSIAPWKIEPALLRRKELTVAENVEELERLFDVYRRHRPDLKLIISVSPVPLNKTFSQTDHVVVANSRSKAVLRVAAEEFGNNHPDSVFYFPSFETVMYGCRAPWESDMRHVSGDAVGRVMRLFQKMFVVDQTEFGYLDYQEGPPPERVRQAPLFRRAARAALRRARRLRSALS